MTKSGMTLKKRPPKPGAQYDFWRKELNKQLETVSQQRAKEYERAVSHFQTDHQPKFKGQIVETKNLIFIRVTLQNGSRIFNKYGTTVRMLWNIWNKGSRAHIIRPRFARLLRFIGRNGQVVFTTLVNHPGTRGTGAKDRIDKRLNPLERRAIDRAGRIAFQRLKRFISR